MGAVEDEVVGEAALPDGEFGGEAAGEAALDEVHDLRDGFVDWGEEQVGVVGHDDEGVEFVCALGAVVLEGFEEELGVRGDLEEAAAVVGDGGDEEGAGGGGSLRFRHAERIEGVRGAVGDARQGCGGSRVVSEEIQALRLRSGQSGARFARAILWHA